MLIPGAPERVAARAASVLLAAGRPSRPLVTICNDAQQAVLYLKLGSAAALTDFTYLVAPQSVVEVRDYAGDIFGIWTAAEGAAQVTAWSAA